MLMLLALLMAETPGKKLIAGKRILMVVAHKGFRDEEYSLPRKIFEENGAKVTVACSKKGTAKGMLGAKIKPDLTIDKVDVKDYDAIIFVGGVGSREYFENKMAHEILQRADSLGKVIGAICLAPCILAKAGILKGKNATVWESKETMEIFEECEVNYTGKPVTVTQNIVTANGPKAAKQFALSIMALIAK